MPGLDVRNGSRSDAAGLGGITDVPQGSPKTGKRAAQPRRFAGSVSRGSEHFRLARRLV
jgi:hypothetical protein